ncbi:MAG: hypothetical protein ACJAWL_000431 [Motiliproteus sp.]|jgi:hypothetical protein
MTTRTLAGPTQSSSSKTTELPELFAEPICPLSSKNKKSPALAELFQQTVTDCSTDTKSKSGANHTDKLTILGTLNFKLNNTLCRCEQGVILAATHIIARVETCSTLTNDDIACQNLLTTESFHA